MAHELEFQILGPLRVCRDGSPVDLPHSAVLRGLLGVLLLAGGEPLPASRLSAAVWAGNGDVSKGAVQVGVSRLRAWLRRVAGAAAPVSVDHVHDGYRLAVPADALDLARFRDLFAAARDAPTDECRLELLTSAMALRRGPVLAGLTTVDSAEPLLHAANQAVRTCVLEFGTTALAVGRPADAITVLEAEAAAAPYDEPLHACLIDLLSALDRCAEALVHFAQVRARLADDLGVAPSEVVQRAYLATLARDQRLAAAAGRPDAAPVPAQLPPAVAGFTGRAGELAWLDSTLVDGRGEHPTGGQDDGVVVIAAVSGTAGVGKTALAVQWAHRARHRFPDGQLYINLRGYDPDQPMAPADALAQLLTSLGVPGNDVPLGVDERAAHFRTATAGRRLLIVLDNASSVEQVRPLLPGDPACAVVVTSRDSLAALVAVQGAYRLDLDLLPEPDALALLRQLIGARVDAEPEAAAAIAERCARLPLALRIAAELAASNGGTALTALVDDLGDRQQRLDRLGAGGDSRADVRAVFSWSYRHLPAPAARTFALLGLHPGVDADLYAIAALTDTSPDEARRMTEILTRAHLTQASGPDRYTMHDLLHAYAYSLAMADHAADDPTAARDRLFDHYLSTAASAMDTLYPAEAHHRPAGPAIATVSPALTDPASARLLLDTERPNLVAVAAFTATRGWPTHAVRLSGILWRYLAGGHRTEAQTIHTYAYRAACESGDLAGQAQALLGLGTVHWHAGQNEPAADYLKRSLALFQEAGDRLGEARSLGNLGGVEARFGHHESAVEHHEQSLALFRELGDRAGEATSLTNLGDVECRLGRYESAAEHLGQALILFERAGNEIGRAYALSNLGSVEERLGRYQPALEHLGQALVLFRQLGNRPGEAWALIGVGTVQTRLGHAGDARACMLAALDLFHEFGDRHGAAWALNDLGDLARAQDAADALEHYTAALIAACETGSPDQQARAHSGLGHAHRALGHAARARHHYEQALRLYLELKSPEADAIRRYLD